MIIKPSNLFVIEYFSVSKSIALQNKKPLISSKGISLVETVFELSPERVDYFTRNEKEINFSQNLDYTSIPFFFIISCHSSKSRVSDSSTSIIGISSSIR